MTQAVKSSRNQHLSIPTTTAGEHAGTSSSSPSVHEASRSCYLAQLPDHCLLEVSPFLSLRSWGRMRQTSKHFARYLPASPLSAAQSREISQQLLSQWLRSNEKPEAASDIGKRFPHLELYFSSNLCASKARFEALARALLQSTAWKSLRVRLYGARRTQFLRALLQGPAPAWNAARSLHLHLDMRSLSVGLELAAAKHFDISELSVTMPQKDLKSDQVDKSQKLACDALVSLISSNKRFDRLQIRFGNIPEHYHRVCAALCARNGTIRALELVTGPLPDDVDFSKLASSLQNKGLEEVRLEIGRKVCPALAEWIKLGIKEFRLETWGIPLLPPSEQELESLVSALATTRTLKKLSFNGFSYRPSHFAALERGLRANASLESLTLHSDFDTDDGRVDDLKPVMLNLLHPVFAHPAIRTLDLDINADWKMPAKDLPQGKHFDSVRVMLDKKTAALQWLLRALGRVASLRELRIGGFSSHPVENGMKNKISGAVREQFPRLGIESLRLEIAEGKELLPVSFADLIGAGINELSFDNIGNGRISLKGISGALGQTGCKLKALEINTDTSNFSDLIKGLRINGSLERVKISALGSAHDEPAKAKTTGALDVAEQTALTIEAIFNHPRIHSAEISVSDPSILEFCDQRLRDLKPGLEIFFTGGEASEAKHIVAPAIRILEKLERRLLQKQAAQ